MTLPNFLLIGAPKAGTTTINIALNQHPEIFMCPQKECGFFWSYGDKSVIKGPGATVTKNRIIRDLYSYQKLFSGVMSEKRVGEASVRYISHPRSPAVIHHFIPKVQLIAVLRQPVDRAYSSYLHALREGVEPCNTFIEAVTHERNGKRDSWNTVRHLHPGFYYQSLSRFIEYFDKEQLHILLFEDLKENAPNLISSIYEFLGVDTTFKADLIHRHNASGIIRNPISRGLWAKSSHLRAIVRPYLNHNLKHSIYEWIIRDLYKPKLNLELRDELTELFRQDIEHLQDFIQRDLSHWFSSNNRYTKTI
jgi:hypothetical protein